MENQIGEGSHLSLSEWKEISRETQENLCEKLGDRIWDEYDATEEDVYIFQNIGTALYGSPKAERDDLGLSDKQIQFIKSIQEKCKKFSFDKSKIRMSVIFVFVYNCNYHKTEIVPLFRVYSNESSNFVNENVIIDHLGRVYKDLTKYIKENTWDMSWLCLPIDGYYSIDKLDEEFIQYIDQSSRGSKLKIFDKLSSVTNIASSVGLVGGVVLSMFPPTAPIGIATTSYSIMAGLPGAAYGTGRSVGKIIDRIDHQQSVSLTDSEARQCWLNTATALVSVTALSSTKILSSLAKSGVVVSRTTRGVCTGISILDLSLSGTAVVNSGYEMLKKPKGEITRLEVFNFSLSVLFFTHSVVKFKTAKSIIEEAQINEVASMKNSIPKEMNKKFKNKLRNTRRVVGKRAGILSSEKKMYGNAEFIRKMRNIDNPNSYFNLNNTEFGFRSPLPKQEKKENYDWLVEKAKFVPLVGKWVHTFYSKCSPETKQYIKDLILKKIEERLSQREASYNISRMDAPFNTNPMGESFYTEQEEYVYEEVTQDQDITLFCNSIAYLKSTCESSDIVIPFRCLEIILEKAGGDEISDVQWKTTFDDDALKNDTDVQIFECTFTVEEKDNYYVVEFIISNNFVITKTIINGCLETKKTEVHELPCDKKDVDNRDECDAQL